MPSHDEHAPQGTEGRFAHEAAAHESANAWEPPPNGSLIRLMGDYGADGREDYAQRDAEAEMLLAQLRSELGDRYEFRYQP